LATPPCEQIVEPEIINREVYFDKKKYEEYVKSPLRVLSLSENGSCMKL